MSWQRLECTTVAADLTEGQEARIADPLWLMGRQWLAGELTAEDAASPVLIDAVVEHTPVTRVRLGPGPVGPVILRSESGMPLETTVECEPVRTGPAAARIAAEAALHLWRLLDAAGASTAVKQALRRRYPFVLDPDDGLDPVGRAQLELLARRAVATTDLYAAVTSGSADLPELPPAGRAALDTWAAWYTGMFSEPPPGTRAWTPERMEYSFQVAAATGPQREVQLGAAEYIGGTLDWYSFNVVGGGLSMGTSGQLREHRLCVVPTSARFAGQAASRWWQVENREVWFGDLATAPEDLARAAMAAFGAVAGDDWFLIPCRLPSGVLARGQMVRVLDTFGETHHIRSCAEGDGTSRVWRFFELSGDPSVGDPNLPARRPSGSVPTAELIGEASTTCPWLFLAPALAGRTESRPVEEVALLRDEVANLAWAVELRVESSAGRSVDRAALARAAMVPAPPPLTDAWRYRLATPVPDHQVPLVPIRTADGGLALRRGRLAMSVAGNEVQTRGAVGEILEPDRPLSIHDEEIPATGATVTRSWQMARTAGGGMVVWAGRRKSAGRPRRSPGLIFDPVTTGEAKPTIQ